MRCGHGGGGGVVHNKYKKNGYATDVCAVCRVAANIVRCDDMWVWLKSCEQQQQQHQRPVVDMSRPVAVYFLMTLLLAAAAMRTRERLRVVVVVIVQMSNKHLYAATLLSCVTINNPHM